MMYQNHHGQQQHQRQEQNASRHENQHHQQQHHASRQSHLRNEEDISHEAHSQQVSQEYADHNQNRQAYGRLPQHAPNHAQYAQQQHLHQHHPQYFHDQSTAQVVSEQDQFQLQRNQILYDQYLYRQQSHTNSQSRSQSYASEHQRQQHHNASREESVNLLSNPLTYSSNGLRRSSRERPLAKLSVSLIDTYKEINKSYYEEKQSRRLTKNRVSRTQQQHGLNNNGWDDENYDYMVTKGESINDRYVLGDRIGKVSLVPCTIF